MKLFYFLFLLALLPLTACSGVDSATSHAEIMSADTLCFHYANQPDDPVYAHEVAERRLDCGPILDSQKPYRP